MYKVLTSFQFDVGAAVLGANFLQTQTEKLGAAAENTLNAYKRLGVSIAGAFGVGRMGLVGSLYEAVSASERFNQIQQNIANILGQNKEQFTENMDSYTKRLEVAKRLMNDLVDAGGRFSLPQMQIMQMSAKMLPMLLMKGVAHQDVKPEELAKMSAREIIQKQNENAFKNVIGISAGLLKSAPILAVDPNLVENQLLEIIEGRVGFSNTLFIRLASETKAFSEIAKKSGQTITKAFNLMPVTERVRILHDALMQFGQDEDYIAAQVKTLRFQLQAFRDSLFGFRGIFSGIGELLRMSFVNILSRINAVILDQGARIMTGINSIFKSAIQKPEETFVNLRTIQKTPEIIKFAGFISKIIVGIELLSFVLSKINFASGKPGLVVRNLNSVTKGLVFNALNFFKILGNALLDFQKFIFTGAGIKKVASLIGSVALFLLKRVLPIITVITTLTALMYRGKAMAEARTLKALPELVASFSTEVARFHKTLTIILAPVTQTFNAIAHLFSYIFDAEILIGAIIKSMSMFNDSLIFMGRIFNYIEGMAAGLVTGIIAYLDEVSQALAFQKLFPDFGHIFNQMNRAIEDVNQRYRTLFEHLRNPEDMPLAAVNQNNNVNIYQDFKEKQDPDRIAFTLQQVLLGIAQNPSQAAARSFSGATLNLNNRMLP